MMVICYLDYFLIFGKHGSEIKQMSNMLMRAVKTKHLRQPKQLMIIDRHQND